MKAPQIIKDAMESDRTSEIILDVGKKSSLPIDKIGKLSYTTFLMMTGALPARDYISELGRTLGIQNDKAAEIAREINTRLFAPIREELKRVHGTPAHDSLVPDSISAPQPVKSPSAAPQSNQTKPLSVPIRREAAGPVKSAPVASPLSAIKTETISATKPGTPVTVPFRSLMEKKVGPVDPPTQQPPSKTAQTPLPVVRPLKNQADATVIASNAPHTEPLSSVKMEKSPEANTITPPINQTENKKSNLHEEVHRLLTEHFESTSAVSTPKAKPEPSVNGKISEKAAPSTFTSQAPKPLSKPEDAKTKTPVPSPAYQSKDPYREPVDE